MPNSLMKFDEFLQSGRAAEAIETFRLNTEAYPQSWNVYDSVGEAYTLNGDKERAIEMYGKSLELNHQTSTSSVEPNTNTEEMVKRLKAR